MDDILNFLKLQHLINNFRKENVGPEQVMCLSDTKLERLGVTKPTDRSRLRRECLDYVKDISIATDTTKVMNKVVNDMEQNNIRITKHGDKDVMIKHHVERIVASDCVRSFCQDLIRENVHLNNKDWVSFAVELFRKLCEDFSDRSILMQAVIVVIIVIIVAVLGYFACKIIPSVIQMFVSHQEVKGQSGLFSLSSDNLNESMKSFSTKFQSLSDNDVGLVFHDNLLDPW